MERAGSSGIHNVAFVKEVVVAKLVSEEAAGNVDLLAPHDRNLLTGQNLLGDDRGQPTEEMTLAIDDDWRRRECGHFESLEDDFQNDPCHRPAQPLS